GDPSRAGPRLPPARADGGDESRRRRPPRPAPRPARARRRERDARQRDGRRARGDAAGDRLPGRGDRGRRCERAHERRAGRGDRGLMQLLLADTNFAEATWIQIVKVLAIFAFILGVTPMVLLLERKLMGRMQSRYGPNRVGPYGLLQPLADVIKLLTKENSTPVTAVSWMMAIAPMISVLTA